MASICIDGLNLALRRGTGIATYARSLLENARQIGFETQVLYGPSSSLTKENILNEAALVEPNRQLKSPLLRGRAVARAQALSGILGRAAKPVRRSGEVIWPQPPIDADNFWAAERLFSRAHRAFRDHRGMTPVVFKEAANPSVMHWTLPLPLYARHIPNIYTIHDLIPLRLPHSTLHDRRAFLHLHRRIIGKADHIAVVSESTRQDVIRLLGVDAERVSVTYQTMTLPDALTTIPTENVARMLASTFNLDWKGYFIHFGAVEPKKNLGQVVEAYLAAGVSRPLVVIGGQGWLSDPELALMRQLHREGGPRAEQIRFYEYMSQRMLIGLLRGARATLFPSLYEGFGLPVLESMALGTPVLTSTEGALPEVAGEAALTASPHDVGDLTQSIRALDADDDLCAELSSRGRERAEVFSPSAYRSRLQQLYARVC
ncbi:glycosyltransferase family 1 protein [Brevundimonas sp. SGAir0440]|uniref:glycosyltransferase family 4 protein n=1 Tax=Brevundimonas sp. SGAir0440 TaxID=2579977 RepID=UPI001FEFC6BF|nr:glycosyltransferase family 1 protein [Brevundimonas sp. SGAir0440]